jgi:hypothetical protein
MKLYSVEVTFDMVIAAKDDKHAQEVARTYASQGLSDLSSYDLGYYIKPYDPKHPPEGYTDDCYPYGNDSKTIKQTLNENTP